MSDRRRNTVVLLLVAALLAASAVVIATKPTRLGLDLKGGVSLDLQGHPDRPGESGHRNAQPRDHIMRKRVDQLGVAQPEIQTTGSQRNRRLAAGGEQRQARSGTGRQGRPAALLRLGAERDRPLEGTPEPSDRSRHRRREPAAVASGLPEYQAVLRAAKRPAIVRSNDTTYSRAARPRR